MEQKIFIEHRKQQTDESVLVLYYLWLIFLIDLLLLVDLHRLSERDVEGFWILIDSHKLEILVQFRELWKFFGEATMIRPIGPRNIAQSVKNAGLYAWKDPRKCLSQRFMLVEHAMLHKLKVKYE